MGVICLVTVGDMCVDSVLQNVSSCHEIVNCACYMGAVIMTIDAITETMDNYFEIVVRAK